MLEYDKSKRATAIKCLNHEWILEAKTYTPTGSSKNLVDKSVGDRKSSIKLKIPIPSTSIINNNENEENSTTSEYYDLEDQKLSPSSSKFTIKNSEAGEIDILKEEF